MVHIAVLLMVKNEKKRLNVSLESVKDFADSLVIFEDGCDLKRWLIKPKFIDQHPSFFMKKNH